MVVNFKIVYSELRNRNDNDDDDDDHDFPDDLQCITALKMFTIS